MDDSAVDAAWLEGVNVLFTDHPLSNELAEQMTSLKWVHITWAAAYHFFRPSIVERPVQITTTRGIQGIPFSEFGLACLFALAKKLPEVWRDQARHHWGRPMPEQIAGKTLFIVGLGSVGTELAQKAQALGMHVIATKRTVETKPPFVEELRTPEALHELLPLADFVVLSLPDIAETEWFIGEDDLRLMKRSAYLINLEPKQAIAESALVRALKEGWIAGAALDALPREPLPPDSELWDLPNVIISPRIADAAEPPWDLRMPIFLNNLRRFATGEPLADVVDKQRGY